MFTGIVPSNRYYLKKKKKLRAHLRARAHNPKSQLFTFLKLQCFLGIAFINYYVCILFLSNPVSLSVVAPITHKHLHEKLKPLPSHSTSLQDRDEELFIIGRMALNKRCVNFSFSHYRVPPHVHLAISSSPSFREC